jgi:hypothetical protein
MVHLRLHPMTHRHDLSRMMRMADLPSSSSRAKPGGFFGGIATAAGQSATISFISIPPSPHAPRRSKRCTLPAFDDTKPSFDFFRAISIFIQFYHLANAVNQKPSCALVNHALF